MQEALRTKREIMHHGPAAFQRGSQWFVTIDGQESVPVPEGLAENISSALRIQDKVDDALMSGIRPGFLRTIRMLNCRKAVSAVRGTRSLRELVHGSKKKVVTPDDIERLSGVPELLDDIERISRIGRAPVLGTKEAPHIREYFDDHPQDIPAVVHIFNIRHKYEPVILSKLLGKVPLSRQEYKGMLHRDHTFLVLGKTESGSYVCFHKQGPHIHHRFELRDLDSVVKAAVNDENRTYLTVIGPASEESQE